MPRLVACETQSTALCWHARCVHGTLNSDCVAGAMTYVRESLQMSHSASGYSWHDDGTIGSEQEFHFADVRHGDDGQALPDDVQSMRDSFTENAKGNNAGLVIVGRSESSEAASDHPITPVMEGLAERGGGERIHSNAARLPRRTTSHDRTSSSGPDRRQSTEGMVSLGRRPTISRTSTTSHTRRSFVTAALSSSISTVAPLASRVLKMSRSGAPKWPEDATCDTRKPQNTRRRPRYHEENEEAQAECRRAGGEMSSFDS